jgi:fibronectin type 3 domain-containing protein
LVGYNIVRATGDGPFTPLAQRVPLPAYTDTQVQSGQRYRYAVSAVDVVGNESERSTPPASVQVE